MGPTRLGWSGAEKGKGRGKKKERKRKEGRRFVTDVTDLKY